MKLYIYEYRLDKNKFYCYETEACIKPYVKYAWDAPTMTNNMYYFWQNDEWCEPVKCADQVHKSGNKLHLYSEHKYDIRDVFNKFCNYQHRRIEHIIDCAERDKETVQKEIEYMENVMQKEINDERKRNV